MKHLLPLLLALCLLLTGCAELYPTEYLYQAEHKAPFAFREVETTMEETEPPLPEAGDYYELRSLIRSFVIRGTEHGQIRIDDYSGDLEQDLRQVTRYLTTEDPISAYATDYINCERQETEDGWLIQVDAVYRRSVNEIAAIRSVRGREAALAAMLSALRETQSSVTLQVSGYVSANFAGELTEYCMEHPNELPEVPSITVSVYPDSGNVRVVEVHFVYQYDRETQRVMRAETESNLDAAYSYIRYAGTEQRKLQLLYAYFINRFSYRESSQEANVYTLLCEGVSDSRSFASVVQYLCREAGMETMLVSGSRGNRPYYWNIVRLGDRWVHLDFQKDILNGSGLQMRVDTEMQSYDWDRNAFPVCEQVPPPPSDPPATQEPEPPITEPPAPSQPIWTEPTPTDPPYVPPTEPPVTEPPLTEPPGTEPPGTEPPVTEPPETEPPTTEPTEPVSTEPVPPEETEVPETTAPPAIEPTEPDPSEQTEETGETEPAEPDPIDPTSAEGSEPEPPATEKP